MTRVNEWMMANLWIHRIGAHNEDKHIWLFCQSHSLLNHLMGVDIIRGTLSRGHSMNPINPQSILNHSSITPQSILNPVKQTSHRTWILRFLASNFPCSWKVKGRSWRTFSRSCPDGCCDGESTSQQHTANNTQPGNTWQTSRVISNVTRAKRRRWKRWRSFLWLVCGRTRLCLGPNKHLRHFFFWRLMNVCALGVVC